MNDRRRALLVSGEMHFRTHVRMHVADIFDCDLRFNDKRIPIRDDIHYLVTAVDHATNGKYVETDHSPAIRRADLDAIEDRLRVHEFRNHLYQLRLSVTQVLGDLHHPVVIQLSSLLDLLCDRLTSLGDTRL